MTSTRANLLLLNGFGCLIALTDSVTRRVRALSGGRRDRGDIPGWVMIAIMSAAVVVVLIPFVGPIIGRAFSNAVDSVSNTKSGVSGP
ncbi:MAG TPA: hypothetical protein VHC41_00385 [Mycobacteriales bacterium]|jgi:hypothetical protein|nr:hypothetical protein [Mycobacteriales bacterium]